MDLHQIEQYSLLVQICEVFTHIDATVDIDNGVNVDADDNCVLACTDTTEYLFFTNETEKTNLPKLSDLPIT